MNIRKIIKAQKAITKTGSWASGVMPKSAFPLSKSGNKTYKLGNRRWRIVVFDALDAEFRLFINYHPALYQYQAMLGFDVAGDMKVLASLEFHPTHGGWHVHVCCDEVGSVPVGVKRGPWLRNLNGSGPKHSMPCPETDSAAFNRAVSFFRLDRVGGGWI